MASAKNIERARRGAAWLDAHLGRGWRRKIRRRSLRMDRGQVRPGECGCILAQLDLAEGYSVGSFSRFADSIGLRALIRYGFVAASSNDDQAQYADLTEAWREVLREPA